MRTIAQSIFFVVLLVALGTSRAAAQNDQQQNGQPQGAQPAQPDQPIGEQPANGEADNGDANVIPAVVQPDLQASNGAGAFRPTFELPPDHSYILPRFDFMSTVNTNGAYSSVPGQSQLASMQYLLGGLTIEKVGRTNELSINYLGGRSFSTDGDIYNATTQLFGLQDRWLQGRWSGTLADQLSYASDTYFGGGVGSPGIGIPGLNLLPGFTAGQGVVVGRVPILNNNAVAEFDYQTSQRSSVTFVTAYSLFHYYGSGLTDNDSILGEAGYNYQLSARSSFAVEYLFDTIRFEGNLETINENVLQATYAYHIAQRMVFQISAGPDIALIQTTGNLSNTNVSYRLASSLGYQLQKTALGIGYSHMLTGGSGVFLGSEADAVTATVSRQFARFWSANVNFGYARNSALRTNGIVTPTGTYDTVYGGAGIARQIGRDWRTFVNFQGTYQVSSLGTCASFCSANLSNQEVVAGVEWRPRALAIE